MFSRHIRQMRCFVCGRGMKHEYLRSLTYTNPYVTDRVEFIAGLMYTAISGTLCQCRTAHRIQAGCGHRTLGKHSRIQAACGHRTLWADTAGYKLPVDTEHCVQALVNETVRCVHVGRRQCVCSAKRWFVSSNTNVT
jgi:hypothetical protein